MSKLNSDNRNKLNRREALLLSAAGLGAALTGTASASDSTKTAVHQEGGDCSTPRTAIARTQYGKVRGFLDDGRVVEFTTSWYRGDIYDFVAELQTD